MVHSVKSHELKLENIYDHIYIYQRYLNLFPVQQLSEYIVFIVPKIQSCIWFRMKVWSPYISQFNQPLRDLIKLHIMPAWDHSPLYCLEGADNCPDNVPVLALYVIRETVLKYIVLFFSFIYVRQVAMQLKFGKKQIKAIDLSLTKNIAESVNECSLDFLFVLWLVKKTSYFT